jgi:asparagine synthase (glutamine-hydrolysing)
MCGIALIVGEGADPAMFRTMINAVAPRGEVEELYHGDRVLAGTQRLPIVDRDRAVQPWRSDDGDWLLCYNGELFNQAELRSDLAGIGRAPLTRSDTELVMEAFLAWGERAVGHLRGEYAFAVVQRSTGRTYLARDPLGVKPLYLVRSGTQLYVASEIKALVQLGVPVTEVLPGHHGWADRPLTPHTDPAAIGVGALPVDDPDEAAKLVRAAVQDSIRVRVDTDLTVGVVLSGGLDSTLTLAHVREYHPDCVAFTVGTADSEDLAYARRVTADLGVAHEVIELRPRDLRPADIREAIRISELTEYGDVINAVASVPLFRRVHETGVKVVLTGDGSDELFGGYPMYHRVGPDVARRLFLHKLGQLYRTELQRVDRTSMAFGVEARVPFLDPALVELAMRLPIDLKMRDGVEKWILREAFADMLPDYIRARPKNPMSHSSGLHERARLFRPMFARMYRSYGYQLAGPMRRDFGVALTRYRHDLDLTLTRLAERPDHTVAEHARDLIGALRHNLLG